MSQFSEQLKKARIASGMTVKEAIEAFKGQEIDISEKTLYGWERGIRTPDADVFLRICNVYNIRTLTQFWGEQGNADESAFMERFHALDAHGKRVIQLLAEEEYSRVHPVIELGGTVIPFKRTKMIDFPVSDQSAAAGTGTYLGEDSFTNWSVPEELMVHGATFGVPVSGNSMEPRYFDGDLLLINRNQMPSVGEIGIFLLDGRGYVKQRGKSDLISLNPQYDPIPMDEETLCFGKVVGVIPSSEL